MATWPVPESTSGKYADRVRVASPRGSVFDGATGTVTRVYRDAGTVMVRLDPPYKSVILPFGLSEVQILEWGEER